MKFQSILVARKTDAGFQPVSSTGQVWPSAGASHPLVGGMSEADHAEICKAAVWLFHETAAREVDLASGYRVSLYRKAAK